MITVDSREYEEVLRIIDYLTSLDIEVKKEFLDYGDYIINEKLTIERKEITDFLTSWKDGRLQNQLTGLKTVEPQGMRIALLIEKSPAYAEKQTDWNPMAIVGIINSIIFGWKVPVIFSPSERYTAFNLAELHTKFSDEGKKKEIYPIRAVRKSLPPREVARGVVEGFPEISATLADRLLKGYGSIFRLVTGLGTIKVEGIGDKRVEEIGRIISVDYNEENQDG